MDPKTLASLDPKLKETYERVMGTASNTTTPPVSPSSTTPNEPTPPTDQILTTNPFATPNGPTSDSTTNALNPDGLSETLTTTQNTTPDQTNTQPTDPFNFNVTGQKMDTNSIPETTLPAPTTPSTSPVIKLLYIVAAIIFFLIYTFFWLKIFNFPLPF